MLHITGISQVFQRERESDQVAGIFLAGPKEITLGPEAKNYVSKPGILKN